MAQRKKKPAVDDEWEVVDESKPVVESKADDEWEVVEEEIAAPKKEYGPAARFIEAATTPLTDAPSRFARKIAEEDYSKPPVTGGYGMLNAFGRGAIEGLGDIATSLTSPADMAALVLSGGASLGYRTGLRNVANILRRGTQAASVPVVAHGVKQTLGEDKTPAERAFGLAELAGGSAGIHFPEPKARPAKIPKNDTGLHSVDLTKSIEPPKKAPDQAARDLERQYENNRSIEELVNDPNYNQPKVDVLPRRDEAFSKRWEDHEFTADDMEVLRQDALANASDEEIIQAVENINRTRQIRAQNNVPATRNEVAEARRLEMELRHRGFSDQTIMKDPYIPNRDVNDQLFPELSGRTPKRNFTFDQPPAERDFSAEFQESVKSKERPKGRPPITMKDIDSFLRDEDGSADYNRYFQGEEDLGYSNRTNDPDTIDLGDINRPVDLEAEALRAGADTARPVESSFSQRLLNTLADETGSVPRKPKEQANVWESLPDTVKDFFQERGVGPEDIAGQTLKEVSDQYDTALRIIAEQKAARPVPKSKQAQLIKKSGERRTPLTEDEQIARLTEDAMAAAGRERNAMLKSGEVEMTPDELLAMRQQMETGQAPTPVVPDAPESRFQFKPYSPDAPKGDTPLLKSSNYPQYYPNAPKKKRGPTRFQRFKNFVEDESGEFDPDALTNFVNEPDRTVQRPEVSGENRRVIDNMPDEALSDFIIRTSDNPNYREPGSQGLAMFSYAQDVWRLRQDIHDLGLDRLTPEQGSDAIRYYTDRGRTDIVDYLTERHQLERTAAPQSSINGLTQRVRNQIDDMSTRDLEQFINDYPANYRQHRGYDPGPGTGGAFVLEYANDALRARQEGYAAEPLVNEEFVYPDDPMISETPQTRAEAPAMRRLMERPTETGRVGRASYRRGNEITFDDAPPTSRFSNRLQNIVGEERFKQLESGERQVDFDLQPDRPTYTPGTRPKKLDRYTIDSWNRSAQGELDSISVDPSKPGLTIDPPVAYFPDSLSMVYRDAEGKAIGLLRSDLAGRGISSLYVSPKIGLRRGKVTFELLKQAFDRGINEPSGITSDLTKNLISRVKKLIKSDVGEINVEPIINAFNRYFGIEAPKNEPGVGQIIPEDFTMPHEFSPDIKQIDEPVMGGYSSRFKNFLTDEEGSFNLGSLFGNKNKTPMPQLPDAESLPLNAKIQHRPELKPRETSLYSRLIDVPKGFMSVDLPFMTSAAFRQTKPLMWTPSWFNAWTKAAKAYGSEAAADTMLRTIEQSKNFKPRYKPMYDSKGNIKGYKESPSNAERIGVELVGRELTYGEEQFGSRLAEKFPIYGNLIKRSNRAFAAFVNHLRQTQTDKLLDALDWSGNRDNEVVAKALGDYVMNATGRGSLKWAGPGGRELNLERIAPILQHTLWSPRLLASNTKFLNPFTYTSLPAEARKQYIKSAMIMGGSWISFATLAQMAGAEVNLDPTNSDFGKIKIGNTRIDPAGGLQQLIVLMAREAPKAVGEFASELTGEDIPTGRFTSSASGKTKKYGEGAFPVDRASVLEDFSTSKLNPVYRLAYDLLRVSKSRPVHLNDRVMQMALPIMAQDIMDAVKEDPSLEKFLSSSLLSSVGLGVNTYGRGEKISDPAFTDVIEESLDLDRRSLAGTIRDY